MSPDLIAALLPTALRAAGVPPPLVALVEDVGPEVARQLLGLLDRHEAGVPLHVLRAEGPDPIAAIGRVDQEDGR